MRCTVFCICLAVAALAGTPQSLHAEPVEFSGTGNYYDYVLGQMDWDEALAAADALSYQGYPGHLVTITTQAENDFISAAFASGVAQYFAWIGGYEPFDDGAWFWAAGPESGVQFAEEATPLPPYNYANWGGLEPNDHSAGEDFAAINLGSEFANVLPGEWIDSPNPNPSDPIFGYIVEYETGDVGVSGDVPTAAFQCGLRVVGPNPASSGTGLHLAVSQPSEVTIRLYDIAGRKVGTVLDGVVTAAGEREVRVSCSELPSGIYFAELLARASDAPQLRSAARAQLVVVR
jgi:hypothetical protein